MSEPLFSSSTTCPTPSARQPIWLVHSVSFTFLSFLAKFSSSSCLSNSLVCSYSSPSGICRPHSVIHAVVFYKVSSIGRMRPSAPQRSVLHRGCTRECERLLPACREVGQGDKRQAKVNCISRGA